VVGLSEIGRQNIGQYFLTASKKFESHIGLLLPNFNRITYVYPFLHFPVLRHCINHDEGI